MKRLIISAVHDLRFGRHQNRTFEGFDANWVVVYGPNESGKSTLAEFLTWAIGGSSRVAAQADAFRGGGDGKLGGRLVGSLNADIIELQANFELLERGTPRDKRLGYVGSTKVDGAAFKKFIGGITSADFELMYRCYGASLGDIGSSAMFEDLFAQFAMGGTSGVRNPRVALEGLRKSTKSAEEAVKQEHRKILDIHKEIKKARSNPDVVDALLTERAQIQQRISDLVTELTVLEKRQNLLTRVIDGRDHRTSLESALAELADLPVVSPQWLTVVSNSSEIKDLVSRIASGSRSVDDKHTSFVAAAAVIGMDITQLEGVTFSAPERLQITTAATTLLQSRNNVATALSELSKLDAGRTEAETSVLNLANTIGLNDDALTRLEVLETQLPDLVNRAVRWREDSDKAIDADAQLVGETKRRDVANDANSPQSPTRAFDPKVMALAVLVVAGLSVVHWGAAIVAGIAAAGFFLFARSSSSTSVGVLGTDDLAFANLAGRAAEHRHNAEEHRRLLDDSFGALAKHVTTPDLAEHQVRKFIELASKLRTLRDLSNQIASKSQQVAELEPIAVEAERAVVDQFALRGIDPGLVNSEFDKWLANYETAVGVGVSLATERSALFGLQARLHEFTAPVESEIVGLTPQAVESRVTEMKSAVNKRQGAEGAVREAQVKVRAANLDTPEALALLKELPEIADLHREQEIVSSAAGEKRKERDELKERLGEIRSEVNRMEATEVLPGLILMKGGLEDAHHEATVRHLTLSQAHQLLGAAIDEHERDNQDPVVAKASALIAAVVPDWGTVIKTRDDDNKFVIQRISADGRINERAISDGGRALLYLAIRLAFAEQYAQEKQIALPIICDDPLIHFDDKRQKAAVQLLKMTSDRHQVVLFTCESTTRDLAESMGAKVIEM
ncbi:MAG: AAA family ATPase [Actinobacteria bacterium]|nr:AAA family ATPase [Actinomycetota bacterium]